MTSISTPRVRRAALAVAIMGVSLVFANGEISLVSAADDDCVVVDPSRTEFDRSPALAYRLDGTLLGQLPQARAVTADGTYADFRASTDVDVPNFIVVGDLATGAERVILEQSRDSVADRYLAGLQFSPNGQYLSYVANSPTRRISPLVVIDINGNTIFETDFDVRPEDARFSPDSSKIVFSDDTFTLGRDIWIAETDGSSPPIRIYDAPPDFVVGPHDVPQNAGDFSWAPDSTRFTFEGRNGLTSPPFFAASYEIYIAAADGSSIVQLPSVIVDGSETDQRNPVWSPDGGSIAFNQGEDGVPDDAGFSLVRYDIGAGTISPIAGTQRITVAPQGLDMAWTSSDEIVFNGSRNISAFDDTTQHGVFSVRADGSRIQFVAENPFDGQPFDTDLIAGLMSCEAIPVFAFAGLVPDRIMDTRTGVGVRQGLVGDRETVRLAVAGTGGVPSEGADAVALNVTIARTSQRSFLSVFPSGVDRPTTSNLNWEPNQTKASTVIVKLGDDGSIDFYNNAGDVHVIADVAGWFSEDAGFTAVTPERLLDTRRAVGVDTTARLDRGSLTLQIHGDVVPDTATGVVMNVTAPAVTEQSFLTVFPSGSSDPGTSNLNVFPGVTSSNTVFTQIGTGGSIEISNPNGASHVIADVAGYLEPSSGFEGGDPSRILNTREGQPLGERTVVNVPLRGVSGGVPDTARVAILNVTALRGTRQSFLTVYPGDERPNASNVNFGPGAVVPNLVIATIGADGSVNIYNDVGQVDVVVDVLGWFN